MAILFAPLALHAEESPEKTPTESPVAVVLPPLSPEAAEALAAIRRDGVPDELIKDQHYLISNESKQALFYEHVQDLGGLYLGVGAEQNYLFAGWSKPEVLVLMDFDSWVVRLHKVYQETFLHADTPAEMMALWEPENHDKVKGWLNERYPGAAGPLRYVFEHGHDEVLRRFKWLVEEFTAQGIPTFLTDQGQFDYIKALFVAGRVRMVRGDLTKYRTMKDIAAFSHKFCLPVRLVYLSNVEYYVKFSDGRWRRNLSIQPYDDKSVVLHTLPYTASDYTYAVQSGESYRTWLLSRCSGSLKSMIRVGGTRSHGRSKAVIDKLPADLKRCQGKRPARIEIEPYPPAECLPLLAQ